MNTFQSTVSSPRNQRIMFWVALAVLVGGVVLLVVKLAGGSDSTPTAPAKGFQPTLPPKTTALTANGAKVTSYDQLPAQVKQAIIGFVGPASCTATTARRGSTRRRTSPKAPASRSGRPSTRARSSRCPATRSTA